MYKKKILVFTRYEDLGASSRLRLLQYLKFLGNEKIDIEVSPLFSNEYLKNLYSGKLRWQFIVFGFWNRFKKIFSIKSYDLIIIEKEIFPYFPALFERLINILGVKYLVDYDDATFHSYDKNKKKLVRFLLGKKIDTVMRLSNFVIAGNEYLSSRAKFAGAKYIEVIPTVVDLNDYKVKVTESSKKTLIVGWIGSPLTSKYLLSISHIYKLLKNEFDVHFIAIGAKKENFDNIPIEVLPWTKENEAKLVKSFDVGVMPLIDSPWERGKCGYKLIQYMSCGLPVIASPVGINKLIVKDGVNGFLAKNDLDWEISLRKILKDENLRINMGIKGRQLVEEKYSLQSNSTKFCKIIKGLLL